MPHDINSDPVISRFVEDIRRELESHLRRLILFGSRARGDATKDSDYDCLVVVDEVNRNIKDRIDDMAGEILYCSGVVISLFPVSEETTETRKYSPFLLNVMKEGITL